MKESVSTLSRRSLLTGAAGVLAAPMVLRSTRAAGSSNSLTIGIDGGSYQDLLVKAVFKPFTAETGIRVDIVPRPDMGRVKAQLLSGNVQIDIFEPKSSEAALGSKLGFWERLDTSMLDIGDMLIPPTSDVVTVYTFLAGIAWDPKKYDAGKHPTNFAEYFDLKKFPGRRAFPNHPEEVLEAALLADGIPPKEIYPLDVDRAFKMLERIKPSIVAWQNSPAVVISLLQTGELDFAFTFLNRIKASNEPGGETPLAFSFDQYLIMLDTIAVLKGAPNKENAMKYIAYLMRPDVLARVCEGGSYVPNSKKKVMPMLSAEARKWIPDMNNPKSLVTNGAYWSDNFEAVSRRFKEWVLT